MLHVKRGYDWQRHVTATNTIRPPLQEKIAACTGQQTYLPSPIACEMHTFVHDHTLTLTTLAQSRIINEGLHSFMRSRTHCQLPTRGVVVVGGYVTTSATRHTLDGIQHKHSSVLIAIACAYNYQFCAWR